MTDVSSFDMAVDALLARIVAHELATVGALLAVCEAQNIAMRATFCNNPAWLMPTSPERATATFGA